ncbi:MAG: acetyl-CoA synthase subunit gamma [Clostridia bacterium]|nr:acetyl-CoA synthase subunit gamma [Clostridia bacterium]
MNTLRFKNVRLSGKALPAARNPAEAALREPWVAGSIETAAGTVPLAAARLSVRDRFGSWKVRWSIGRMDFSIPPGLYGVGRPGRESPVLVTANYKMSFDRLRAALPGIDAWILVLDTRGINVWCAAGKGTFGTAEVVRRIRGARLDQVVSHRTLILPQLGASGVQAHAVTRETGFHVSYGPVAAADLPAYLAAGRVATPAMRQVRFNTWDRLVLTPVELVGGLKGTIVVLGVFFLLNAVGLGRYGWVDLVAVLGAVFTGCVLTPVLLPVLPTRLFAVKGAFLGVLWAVAIILLSVGMPADPTGWLKAAGYLLALPAVTAFEAMNFTGCTTYTSPSGVNREMRLTLLPQLAAFVLGILSLLAADVVRLL